MKYDMIISGVGGQGILTIANLLDNAAISAGFHFKQSEIHGMAQRGGGVFTFLRISDAEIFSDAILEGDADMVLSMEPLEVGRYLQYLSADGIVVTSTDPFVNIPNYPDEKTLSAALFSLKNIVAVSSMKIAERANIPRAQNMALLGVALAYLPFKFASIRPHVEKLFEAKGKDVVESNIGAMAMGLKVGLFYRDLIKSGVKNELVTRLLDKLDPGTIDPSTVPVFAKAINKIGSNEKALAAIAQLPENSQCSEAVAAKL